MEAVSPRTPHKPSGQIPCQQVRRTWRCSGYWNTWSHWPWRSTSQWWGRLDILPKSGRLYRAARSGYGKYLWGWDRHQPLDGRAGSSGGSCIRWVYQQLGPWMTATGSPRPKGSTGQLSLALMRPTMWHPGSWIILHTTASLVRIGN